MMENIKAYIMSIVAAAIICGVTRGLLNEKTTIGQAGRLLSGILMAITILSPLTTISFRNITDYFEGISVEADKYVDDGKTAAKDSIAGIIKSQVEAYILDKANRMGLEISVEVELDASNNAVPCGVTVTGKLSPYAKEVMSTYMEENLGIAKENQRWK